MIVFESITIANDKNSFAALVTCIQDLNLTASVSQHHILNFTCFDGQRYKVSAVALRLQSADTARCLGVVRPHSVA